LEASDELIEELSLASTIRTEGRFDGGKEVLVVERFGQNG